MGIDVPSMQLLCCAKSMGVDFSETLTVGRQFVHLADAGIMGSSLAKIGVARELIAGTLPARPGEAPGEPVFSLLGAREVSSVDASDYEQATFIHDLNQPLPASLEGRFSVVHDGGTLEHVFNITQAFKNCMEMVRPGGHFIQVSVANNYMGHGLWQLSPEVIYKMFSEDNGFRVEVILVHIHRMRGTGASLGEWYKVADASGFRGGCVPFANSRPTYICTIARRIDRRPIFATYPQQSVYFDAWSLAGAGQNAATTRTAGNGSAGLRAMRRMIPRPVKRGVRLGLEAAKSYFADPVGQQGYERLSDDDVVLGRV